jgi:hypothetical protein
VFKKKYFTNVVLQNIIIVEQKEGRKHMNHRTVFFADNFFSSGQTDILTEDESKVGSLDLKSMFSASVDVLDQEDRVLCSGKFKFFSNKWFILNAKEEEVGVLRTRFSFFTKKYEYDSLNRGVYTITSPAFSRDYDVLNQAEEVVAKFEKVSGFFSSGAFRLINSSEQLYLAELVALVMGVNAIQKRQNSRAANSGGAR